MSIALIFLKGFCIIVLLGIVIWALCEVVDWLF